MLSKEETQEVVQHLVLLVKYNYGDNIIYRPNRDTFENECNHL